MFRTAALALALAFPLFAQAAIFTVNSTDDAGDAVANGICATSGGVCTLRAALHEANGLAGTDTIHFGLPSGAHTITVAGSSLPISSSVFIDGTTQPGSGAGPFIFIDGANSGAIGFEFASIPGLNVTIQGLAIGRFTTAGIKTYQNASSVTIKKCHIGVGLDGLTDMGNGDGIWAVITDFGGSQLILGDASGGGNVISGNQDWAVEIEDGPTGAKLNVLTLQGNIIGLASDGMTQVANLSGGIRTDLQFGTTTVGGSIAGRNIISGNGGGAFLTFGFLQADAYVISHNYIGVAQDGTTARGNNGSGMVLVGKKYTVESNIIAANNNVALYFYVSNVPSTIRANRIGVALDGTARGNAGDGMHFQSTAGGVIGGAGADQNIIANNGGAGVRIDSGQIEIAENSIFNNGELGIDIGTVDVVDPNDANDADVGFGNNRQNRPEVVSAIRSGGITFINGALSSTPSTTFRIRLFASNTADPSGYGEGETSLGEVVVTTSAAGTAGFTFSTPSAPAGLHVTATATSPGGDTSEFSNALAVSVAPQFRFTAASYPTGESGTVAVSIERTGDLSAGASVGWSTTPGSASGADFTGGSGTAIFLPGQPIHIVNFPITVDTIDEGLESFNVTLSAPSAGYELGTPAATTVQITDDDPPPSISIEDASANEGNAGNTPLTFNVTLSAASEQTIAIDYATSNGTAVAGSDYAAAAGTLTFAAGQTSKSIVVPLTGDSAIELDESFSVALSNPANVSIADGTANGTITNDDGAPAITIDDVAIVEGDAGTSSALFTLALSGPSSATVTVNWSTSDGTATAGVDYEAGGGTATFAPGEMTTVIAVTINGDVLIEDNETFFVDLAGPSNATLADAQGGGTIADDDGTPSLSINDPAIVEGITATFTVTLAPASALPVTVDYATSNLTAGASDYTGATNTLTFAAGETSKPIDIATSGDAVDESTEDFRVTLSAPSGATIGDAIATATIIDDDGLPRITIGNASAAESGGMLTFTVDLSHASASAIDVTWATADGTATAGSDYTSDGDTLTFAPGETSKTIGVIISGDTLVESDETLLVQLTGASNATITDGIGAGTITNDDGIVTVSIANVSASEGTGGPATIFTFNVTLSAVSADTITVQWATGEDTDADDSDYVPSAGNLVFAPGDTLQTISVPVIPDAVFEGNDTFFVSLLAASNAIIADDQAAGTIVNDDAPPAVPSVSIVPASVTEGNTGTAALVFVVALTVPTVNTVTVNYATSNGTASAADYVATSGTLTFAPGVTLQTVTVPVIGDVLIEGDETLTVTLSGISNATAGTLIATGTIVDDDVTPVISIAPASAVEGTPLTFTVSLNVPTAALVTVDWATTGYNGTLTFAPGVMTQTILVPTVDDALVDGTETILVTLSAPANATLGTATANGTILDNDTAPAVPAISIAPASAVEGAPLTFNVTLSVPTTALVTVDWTTTDYNGTLTFAPSVTAQTILVPTVDDAVVDGTETILVTLAAPTNATLGTATANGTILDNDTAPAVPAISIAPASAVEGAPLTFDLTLSVPTTALVTVDWATTGYNGTLTFAPSVTTQTILVPTVDDALVDGTETILVTLSSPTNATLGTATANGTILDNDTAPAVPSISIAPASAVEGAPLTFNVTLSVPTTALVTVDWTTTGYNGTLTFAPSVTTQTILIPTVDDALVDGTETILVTLSAPTNATLGTATANGTILDNDTAPAVPAISIAPASAVEGAPLTFNVTLSVPTTALVTVDWNTTGYNGTLTFAPAVTAQTILIPTVDDALVDGTETILVTLSAPTNGTLGTATANGTILDNDTAAAVPSISIANVARDEGDAGATLFVFPVTLSAATTATVSVDWTTSSGTDFIAANGTLVFAPGMTSQTISIAVHGDEKFESDETFTVQLSAPINATIADATALGTIRNDDHRPPTIPSLHAAAVSVSESAGEAIITLTLSARATNGASVRWMTRGGTATGAVDFTETSGRTTFGSNTTATIAIPITADTLDESDETFVIELFDAADLTLSVDRVEITILDDDETAPERAIVMAVGSLHGNNNSRFGTAVQMINFTDAPATGNLVIRPAGTTDPAFDVAIPYTLAPRELRAWDDLLAEHGLQGLATLDVIPATGATPRLTVRIYDDGSGHGTTGFTLPTVAPSDALLAGDTGLLVAPDDPIAMRFNIGIRTLDAGATMTIEVRDRTGALRHTATRDYAPNWFNQLPANDFAGVALSSGDYLAIHVTRGSAILYGASVDNATNDPSVQVVSK